MASGTSAKNINQLLALHSKMVDTACASETKRQSVSISSAAMISAGVTVFAVDRGFHFAYLSIPFLIISSIWFVTVRFYQNLAKAKWKIILEIEEDLAFAPFTKEWENYLSNKDFFTFGPSTLEQVIPAAIFCSTLLYILYLLLSSFC